MSAAFRPAGFWLETVQGYWISDSDITIVKPEKAGDGSTRYIATLRRSGNRYQVTPASYLAAFGGDEGET